MRRTIPSTWALQAFEASARHESFTRAGEELALTQSAICRQIGALEELLGVPLFSRSKRGVKLTAAGAAYSRKIAARLDEMERDTLALMSGQGLGGSLELAVVPTFATRWLIPRLGDFQELHPDITVNLTTNTRPFLFAENNFDAAIYFGDAVWPGTRSHALMREDLIPVASPQLLKHRAHMSPADLAGHPLLQQSTRPYAWRRWFESAGVSVSNDLAGPRYELFTMLAEAARQGLGIALLPRFLFADDIHQGHLITPVAHVQLSDVSYRLIYPEHHEERSCLSTFSKWLGATTNRFADAAGLA